MIVAVAPAGTGQVAVEEFREAASEAQAVADFCNDYTPAKDPANFVGHDAGAQVPTSPPGGWYYDHDSPGLVAALEPAKAAKVEEIDARTDELIAVGFEFPPASGLRHSLSIEAQAKIMAAYIARENPAFVYPVTWNTIDDLASIDLANAAAVEGYYLTALGTVRAYLDSGTTFKAAVRAAATQAELDAVVDSR